MLIMFIATGSWADDSPDERDSVQAKMDADCETARQKELVSVRAGLVSECVQTKERPDTESCERAYAHYGERAGSRPPLFYDLPACVEAYEHKTSYRSSGE
jgi:hypothetical protein